MEPGVADILRKVSLASQGAGEKNKYLEEAKIRDANKGKEPADRFYMFHILLMLLGLMQMLPSSFFLTANDYWMYKFRNTTLETTDSSKRTSMQAFFASWTSMLSSIPSVISLILSTFYGHRVRIRSRLLMTLFIVLSCFVIFTAFIKIDTDEWQFGFFCLTMVVIVVIHGTMSLFHASSMVLISKFPIRYTQFYLYGEGSSGIFSAILQIISLAIVPSSETAALIYFLVGTSMIAITYLLLFLSKYLALVQYYMANNYEDPQRPMYKLSDIIGMLKKIWPCVTISCIMMLNGVATHPNVTSLIVSEHNGNGDPWADKYFVPCITYFYSSICSLLGRIVLSSVKIKKSAVWIWIPMIIVRMFIFVSLIVLCNAQPRHHLPVVFGHDWEYALIVGLSAFTSGAIFNIIFLSMQEFIDGNAELAYLSMITFISVYHAIISPLGLLFVKIL